MKNQWGKAHKIARNGAQQTAYHVGKQGSWTWYVLKAWGDPRKPYARAFCLVVTPMTDSQGELGDVYSTDVPGLIPAWVAAHAPNQEHDAPQSLGDA
jgi:hypothetical protein